MGRNLDRRDRCKDCLMKSHMCICSILCPISEVLLKNKTHISILMHHRETVTTTNTARMALKVLTHSSLHIRGLINTPLSEHEILKPTHSPIYLYPTETAEYLTPDYIQKLKKPVQLIVPDGSWRQTRRFAKRESWLKNIPHVKLQDSEKTLFFLRRRVKENGISTFEAIARAIGLLEGAKAQVEMEQIFKIMIQRTLQTRGKSLENYI